MKRTLLFAMIPLLLSATAALAGSSPQGALDNCKGGAGVVHVSGWAYDPDVSSRSIIINVRFFTDSGCTSQYGGIRTPEANVPRRDVNQAWGIEGDHGFDADLSIDDVGDYWVKVFAIDRTGDDNVQIGTTRSVTVAPGLPGSGTAYSPFRIASVADWDAFAANVNAGIASRARYRLDADIGPVTNTVGTQDHPFRGTFDGAGHTLTASLSGTDSFLAPFSSIGGATISNLVVAGTVAGGMHCSGLVGAIVAGANAIENCEVAAAITSSGTHFDGFIGHGYTFAATLSGCVFSGSLAGGTYVATFNGWSDDGAETTLIDCLDVSASPQPIGRGHDAAYVSNTHYLASKNFTNVERLWGEGNRGERAYAVTAGEGVTIDFGRPAATYGTTGIAAYAPGVAHNGTFYAGEGYAVWLDLAAIPPSGMMLDTYVASAGTLSPNGSAWTLAMPAAPVVVNANMTAATPRGKVRLWAGGPFWAETNIGANEPWNYGYFFWWGDTVGYKMRTDTWVASDLSSSDFSFNPVNTPTYGKDNATLRSEGWISEAGVLVPTHDAAQVHWGGDWRMPTAQELDDLRHTYCDWTWTTMKGVSGYVVRGRGDFADASIFLPATGYVDGTSLYGAGSGDNHWSSVPDEGNPDFAWNLYFDSGNLSIDIARRSFGLSIRPVQGPTGTVTISFNANGGALSSPPLSYVPGETYGSLPTATREGYVFAGWFTEGRGGTQVTTTSTVPASATVLYAHWTPDGTHNKVQLWAGGPFWAETNIGADEPWETGCYFWWGDTVGCRRENNAWGASDGSSSSFLFNPDNTLTYSKDSGTLLNEGWITEDGVLAPEHDAAQAHWGGMWRMPTSREFSNLFFNCDWTWTTTNGVAGYVVQGRDDYSAARIFLPAAGLGFESSLYDMGVYGRYWSSGPPEDSRNAGYFYFGYIPQGTGAGTGSDIRYLGMPVRPILVPIDLSALTADYTAQDGNVLTGETKYMVAVPAGAFVTINGVAVTGVGGATVPAPAFSSGGEAITTKFERGAGDTWAITAFAELDNDAIGADVADDAITVYRGDTVDGITNAVTPTITGKKSAVKVEMTVDAPTDAPQQFFRVGFGE